MKAGPEDPDISPAAAELARSAPEAWARFKDAYKRYAERVRDDLLKASLDELQKSQGRAQQCAREIALLDDAVNAADRIRARRDTR